jgi:hypothetical protein
MVPVGNEHLLSPLQTFTYLEGCRWAKACGLLAEGAAVAVSVPIKDCVRLRNR